MRSGDVVRLDGTYYRAMYQDPGILRPENRGLWRALHVTWDGDHWSVHDDDDYLLSDDRKVVAKEIGWGLRREEL